MPETRAGLRWRRHETGRRSRAAAAPFRPDACGANC